MAKGERKEKGAAEYAREALSEWGKAARYGAAAIAAKRRERSDGGHPLGELIDRLKPGELKPGEEGPDASLAKVELPIQASIDIAIPTSAVFALATQLEEFPEFLDRVHGVEVEGDGQATVTAKVGVHERELTVEIVDERPNERIDWECSEGYEHSGVISLHPLAPRLTRLELTVERQPEGMAERLARRVGLTQHVVEGELHRFKAYAELWEEAEDYEPEEAGEPIDSNEGEPVEDEEELEAAQSGR